MSWERPTLRNKTIENSTKLIEKLWEVHNGLSDALDTITRDLTDYKYMRKALSEYADEIKSDIDDEKDLIEKIRAKCTHDWSYQGHSHNDDWYMCLICGEEEDR